MKKKNEEIKREGSKTDLLEAGEPKPLLEWQEDEPVSFPDDENSEVLKLQVSESISGKIIDIIASTSWKGRSIYKIDDGTDVTKVLLGTTVLDRLMSNKNIGDWVKIERILDKPTDKGNPLQQYKTYSRKVNGNAR
jgi:hypothetical protein